jgi:septum formation protein
MAIPVVLASLSPRRKALLGYIFKAFEVRPSQADESIPDGVPVVQIPAELAARKAQAVHVSGKQELIIAADTIVVLDGQILNKPADEQEAGTMLMRLSNRSHQVITGVALLLETGGSFRLETFSSVTEVHFGAFSEDDARDYIASGSPFDKAGGYGIQDSWTARFIRGISGDYYNVMGFPVSDVYYQIKSKFPECPPDRF